MVANRKFKKLNAVHYKIKIKKVGNQAVHSKWFIVSKWPLYVRVQ